MSLEMYIVSPPIFNGLPAKGFFTTKSSEAEIARVSKKLNMPVYMPVQKHTDRIMVLNEDINTEIADGVVTNRKGILIGVQTADCVPALLYDPKKRAAGAVHAGWRGTSAGILKTALNVMKDRFHSDPDDILIAIGPSIRLCCYEVGGEVMEAVAKTTGDGDYYKRKGEQWTVDLADANRLQAVSSGINAENIWVSGDCTFCLPEKYYSYRFAKGATGRQCGFIGIV